VLANNQQQSYCNLFYSTYIVYKTNLLAVDVLQSWFRTATFLSLCCQNNNINAKYGFTWITKTFSKNNNNVRKKNKKKSDL